MRSRFLGVALAAACTGCSLLVSLSGLSGEATTTNGSDGGDTADAASRGPDGELATPFRPAYLFATGGAASAVNPLDPTASAKTFFAEIHADGTLGGWKAGPDLPEAREQHIAVGVGSALYVLGGRKNKTDATDTSAFALHVLPDGGLTPFDSLPSLPSAVSAGAVAAGGHVHAFDYDISRSIYANETSEGLGAWRVQGDTIDAGTFFGSGAAVGTDVFWFGPYSRAIRWPVNDDGSLGASQPTTPPPGTTDHLVIASSNHFLYMVGEWTVDRARNDVFVAAISPTHEVGSWVATEPFPIPRIDYFATVYGDWMYVVGGEEPLTAAVSPVLDVYGAKIGADGKIGLWKKMSATAIPEYHAYTFAIVAP